MTQPQVDASPIAKSDACREMTDDEREVHIRDCGRLMEAAYAQGDRVAAQHWLKVQNEAIAARSPERIAEMEVCYFCREGERARLEALARGDR